ncbi:MAG: hypothetical protein HPY53_01145 [Brevinematales bacterium]|nr:hypothetical protein [Brevinematales bacterium]
MQEAEKNDTKQVIEGIISNYVDRIEGLADNYLAVEYYLQAFAHNIIKLKKENKLEDDEFTLNIHLLTINLSRIIPYEREMELRQEVYRLGLSLKKEIHIEEKTVPEIKERDGPFIIR